MLNLAPPSDGSYDVECISYQTFQDATITQGANVTFEVNSSSTDDKVRFFELTKKFVKTCKVNNCLIRSSKLHICILLKKFMSR